MDNNSPDIIKNEESSRQVKPNNKLLYRFIKRSFDIFASFLFLVIFGWFVLLLIFIKFVEDGHNPIYTSIRVGENGKLIKFHKIRSMIPNAESLKQQLIDEGKNEADGPVFKIKDDPRITRFGKFLRKTSLDELPQIWDIFVGRLSVVGPRPPLEEEVKEYTSYQMHRLDVKGGLLCLWQIQKNRHSLSFDDWVKLDIEYVEKRSLWLDFKIIVKGAWNLLFDHSGE
ncbi:MAG: sugar transferase [Clostridia bacterium]|nr:sugar transferase [Clostridia bacterium]